ncbi:MAG: hypothetical protein R2687_03170 [Candidatus Nanopelagicales bacterium]
MQLRTPSSVRQWTVTAAIPRSAVEGRLTDASVADVGNHDRIGSEQLGVGT